MSGLEPTITVNEGPGAAPAPALETPTERVIKDANRTVFVTDASGRSLGVTRLSASVQRRVLKALSAENGEKSSYVNLAFFAACCVSINGDPVPFPQSEMQIDGLIDRLDDDGMRAVSQTVQKEFGRNGDDAKK